MPRLTDAQWEQVREDWYGTELTNGAICEKYNISIQTLRTHAKREWTYPRAAAQQTEPGRSDDIGVTNWPTDYGNTVTVTESAPTPPADEPPSFTDTEPHDFGTPTDFDKQIATGDLQAQLDDERRRRIAAEQQIRELEFQVTDLRPWVEVDLYDTVDDVIRIIGMSRLQDAVAMEHAALNRRRTLDGLERYTLTDEETAERIQAIAAEMLAERSKFEDENPHRTRVLKMVRKDGAIVQAPAEDQINNMRGSRSDWYTLYTDRGQKVAVDRRTGATICGSLNCWRVAAKDERNNYTYLGYCSEGHMRWVEGNKPQNPALTPVGANTTGREVSRTGLV